MLGFLPTRAYRPGTPGATTFLSPLSGTFNYGWDSFVTDGVAGDGIFPPEVGETMTVDFSTFFIEPQRNKEKNACSGAGDLSQLEASTTIAILGVAVDPG